MVRMLENLKNINPVTYVLVAVAAILGYGANRISRLIAKENEKLKGRLMLLFKSIALVLAAGAIITSMYL